MQRSRRLLIGLVLAILAAVAIAGPGRRGGRDRIIGDGRAYAKLGALPVKHRGRVKPLEGMAAEEVKLIHGRPSITLFAPDGETTSTWEPVAAVLDWSARPEYWDEQDFILADRQPLNRLLLEAAAARQAGETSPTGKRLNALAARIVEGRNRLSPRLLETVPLQIDGRAITFPCWVGEILDRKERGRSDARGDGSGLSPLEEQAAEVGERLFHFQGIRDHKTPANTPLDLLVIPRPPNDAYRSYSAEVFEKGMKPDQSLSPLEADVADALLDYLQGLPSKEWALPGEDAMFDQKYASWLPSFSRWMPLGVILQSSESELSRAGFPLTSAAAFRKSYRELEAGARAAPGNVPEGLADAVLAAARDLAVGVGYYPEPIAMTRETALNRLAPFSKALAAYGFSVMLLLLSFGVSADPRTRRRGLGVALYRLGMVGLAAGAALQLYGCWIRFRVNRWVPGSTLYETVVWLALTTAVMGLAIELLRWRRYAALAAAGVALLATVVAENASFLDPTIQAVEPALQSNRRLAGHVLTIITAYAAFATAMGLGMLAMGRFLTATYRQSPSCRALAWPLWLGLPCLVLGRLGIDPPHRPALPSGLDPQALSFASSGLAALGWALSMVGGFSLFGEFANRTPRRAFVVGVVVATAGLAVSTAGASGIVQGPLAGVLASDDVLLAPLIGVALIVLSLLAVHEREAFAPIESSADSIAPAMLVGVLLLTAGAIAGGAWARGAWGAFWSWDPKQIWVVITLTAYLAALLGRFAGRLDSFGTAAASIACFLSVLMSWYGLNVAHRVGRHTYGFTGNGDPELATACALVLLAAVGAAAWRRSHAR